MNSDSTLISIDPQYGTESFSNSDIAREREREAKRENLYKREKRVNQATRKSFGHEKELNLQMASTPSGAFPSADTGHQTHGCNTHGNFWVSISLFLTLYFFVVVFLQLAADKATKSKRKWECVPVRVGGFSHHFGFLVSERTNPFISSIFSF